jgi:L-seryl-tRNA(Ser) seleniumtransferase
MAEGDPEVFELRLAEIPEAVVTRAEHQMQPSLRSVINATGVVIHTNLGRAPLPMAVAQRVAQIAASYSNLEYDLESGGRGQRENHIEARLRRQLGAEAALVVNNNAAAVLLAVNTLAEGREVLVSRGELVEIGGSFRIPDVLRKGGAILREVGTTNRTRLSDYEAGFGPDTALVLKVHPSNFEIVGFTQTPKLEELVEFARRTRIPLVEDMGSGLLASLDALPDESTAAQLLKRGVGVVTFSGDKLLGGPQAGVIVGRATIVDAMRRNPLYRALRVDKMTLAALDAILVEHDSGAAEERVPVLRMVSFDPKELRRRAEAFAQELAQAAPMLSVVVQPGYGAVGGGAAPTMRLTSSLVAIEHERVGADALAASLRVGDPAVVARIAEGALLVDLRTVALEEEAPLRAAIMHASS